MQKIKLNQTQFYKLEDISKTSINNTFDLALILNQSYYDGYNYILELNENSFLFILDILFYIEDLNLIQAFIKQDRNNLIKEI